jgi:hypothetical protein
MPAWYTHKLLPLALQRRAGRRPPAALVLLHRTGWLSVPLMPEIVLVEDGFSCSRRCALADSGSESGQDSCGRGASGAGEVVAIGARDFVDQAVGSQKAELATGPA